VTVDTIGTSRIEIELPAGWRTVRFGDVVRNVDLNERNPREAGIERYVGLDHLDPESLHIKRWGLVEEGTTFTRKFTSGQVLFGKRRAYQRKAAVGEFEGICSGDILVFEPLNGDLIGELLPFIVQSDGFFNHALGTSAGSLSPRTKWKDLADYEFALPPRDEQRRIAEILWAADESSEHWISAHNTAVTALDRILVDIFLNPLWPREMLKSHVLDSAYGPRFSNTLYSETGAVGCLRTTDLLDDGTIIYSTVPRADLDPKEFENHILESGDFMISRSGTCGIGCVYNGQDDPMVPGAFLIRLRLRKSLSPYFLKEYVNSPIGKPHIANLAQGAVQKNIRGSLLLLEKIPVPQRSEQDKVIRIISAFREQIETIATQIKRTSDLKKNLLHAVLAMADKQLANTAK
jgi:type I restriction enzyme S subunit